MENHKIEVFQSSGADCKMPLSSISLRLNFQLISDYEEIIDLSNNLATPKLIRFYESGSNPYIDAIAKSMIDLLDPYIAGKLTVGFEIHNKAGELCRPHFHIHFLSNSPKETIRTALYRYFSKNDIKFKSKTDYSISSRDVEETNMRKHFRYPLKMDYPILSLCHGFTKDQLQVLQMEAKAHLKNVRDHLSEKIEKKSSPTLSDQLFAHIDSEYPPGELTPEFHMKVLTGQVDYRKTFLHVAIVWMDKNNKDFTASSIVAKVNRYMRLRKYMSVDNYIETIEKIM